MLKSITKVRTPEQRKKVLLIGKKALLKKSTTPSVEKQQKQNDVAKTTTTRTILDEKVMQKIDALHAGVRRGTLHLKALDNKKREAHVQAVFHKCEFLGAANNVQSVIPNNNDNCAIEVCFIGRSNVGKSSLINALLASNKARVSERPGLTQTINFYAASRHLHVVDMPGYGFAFAKDEAKQQWKQFVMQFILQRASLKRVFVLLDARHGMKKSDAEFCTFLNDNKIRFQIVLTKNDQVQIPDLAQTYMQTRQHLASFKYTDKNILLVSSKTRSGIYELQKFITGLVPFTQLPIISKE